jgi:HlyD family secretion protein
VEEQRANVNVDVVSPQQDWAGLGDGYQVDAQIAVFRQDDAILVPTGALFRTGDTWNVYILRDGRAELRKVELLRRASGLAALTSGVEPGEQVIVYPSDSISSGVRVRAR